VLPAQRLQRLGQQMGDGAGAGAQAHAAAVALHLAAHVVQRLVGIGQQAPCAFDQRLAHAGGHHACTPPHQQTGAQARLQLGHVKRHGRRRQVQHTCGSGKTAQVGHRQQGAQAVEVDLAHHAAPFRFSEGRLCQIQLVGIDGCRDDVRSPAPESPRHDPSRVHRW
jgi:hypothetical protein